MSIKSCDQDTFPSTHNRSICCDLCKKGSFMKAECSLEQRTSCQPCEHGHYMDKLNFLQKCQPCKNCPDNSFLESKSECRADRDRQCKCKEGFYCLEKECNHCHHATKCSTGEGVKTKHTSESDTVCVPCARGTYSNVTDLYAPCLKHTDCESLGGKLVTHGTNATDAKCAPNPNTGCLWVVPASLWVGFVATVLVTIIVYVYWRRSRRCRAQITGSQPTEKPGHLSLILHESDLQFPTLCFDDKFNNHPPPCEVQISDFMGPSEIECDGVTMTVLTSAENVRKLDMAGDGRGNFNHVSLCHSEPQEDEWAET
ncbi:tumor necrosis factor receptor superfamily member 5 [Brienomyrus brachyistius]|uniref:tumor necrosis factor receptor superfamily member 5 n=1 Tax=Brienomyrus brachyistius TaxID=42636 RepID=UPI0020B45887|nr:tumor necrosis factor receptor superfamily member 5 [Brienomyrus brachyistius]